MSDSADIVSSESVPTAAGQPVTASAAAYPPSEFGGLGGGTAAQHPEVLVGAAFAGGLLLATILKRLAN